MPKRSAKSRLDAVVDESGRTLRDEVLTDSIEPLPPGTGPSVPAYDKPTTAGSFVLLHELDELKSRPQYMASGHAARTLVKRPDLRIVLIVLQCDRELKQHSTEEPVSIHTLTGRIRIALPDQSIDQTVGGLLVIEPGVMHDVTALEDSAFLLSMPWSAHRTD
jgi:quercetin dioxygenase-like cupin family protein